MESVQQRSIRARLWRGFPAQAVILSLGLHAAVLAALAPVFVVSSGQTAMPVAPRLQGRLHPAVAVAVPAVDRAVMPQARPLPVRSGAVQQRSATAMPEASALPAPTFAMAAEPAGNAAGEALRSAPVPSLVVGAGQDGGVDAAGLRQFRLALAGEARRFRRYPDVARRAGWQGTAEVRIAVAGEGAPLRAELSRSSGHAVLDEAALDMLRQAAPRIELPHALRGRRFAVLMPVLFEVEDE